MKSPNLIASLFGLCVLSFPALGQIPAVTQIGDEEYVSTSYMEHPAVATDSKAQPHMVGDYGVGNSFMKYSRIQGTWAGGVFASGSRGGRYDASRLYIGQIEIDAKDRAWISCKMGVKEYGDMYGQALWVFSDVDGTAYPIEKFFRFVCVYKGMGLISTDSKYVNEGVMLGTFGNWEKIGDAAQSLGRGSLGLGNGGEKVRFRIASYAPRFDAVPGRTYPDGIWHTAMNGFSALSSQYQNSQRFKAGLKPVTWAEYRAYSRMGDDYCHPGLGTDLNDPRIAYIGCVYGSGSLCINVWDGSRMLFNPSSLKVLDFNAMFGRRQSVQFAPAVTGGTFVFWDADNNVIKMCYMSQRGVSTPPTIVASGRSPGVTTDRYGNIHLVYYNKGICYRKIWVSTLQGLEPKNRVTATRMPRFRWSSTKSPVYTLEIRRDGVALPLQTCASNLWRPSADLAVGNYSWRVKEGKPTGTAKWTTPLAFQIPPAIPVPEGPATRLPTAPIRPTFQWNGADPKANRFLIQLFSQGDLVDTLSVTGHVTSARWDRALAAGGYTWQIRATRSLTDHSVSSDWSPALGFQVAVPGACAVTKPFRLQAFDPGWGVVTCAWTAAEGASSYSLKVLFNGELLERVDNHASVHYQLTKAFPPGYYSLFVQSVNAYGRGPWSPVRTFIVTRQMTPGEGRTLSGRPRSFEWTRSRSATRYLVKLSLYDKAKQKFVLLREVWIPQTAGGVTPRWTPAITLDNGAYRWVVTDYNIKKGGYSSVGYFQIRVPGAPSLLSPVDGVAGLRQLPFTWDDPSAFAEEFVLQVWKGKALVKNLDWTRAALLKDDAGSFTKTFNFDDSETGAYTWRMRSRNSVGSSPWKEESFTVGALDVPELTAPETGAAGAEVPVSWSAVSNATRYEAQILSGPLTLASEHLSGTNWAWTPAAAGAYTLQVRAGETGWSRWTSRSFTAY